MKKKNKKQTLMSAATVSVTMLVFLMPEPCYHNFLSGPTWDILRLSSYGAV